MQFIDTHIHLQDYKLNSTPQIIEAAKLCGVKGFVCVSSTEDDWAKVLDLSNSYPQVIPALGIHPWFASEVKSGWEKRLKKLLEQNPKACVGECGLDKIKNQNFTMQAEVFLAQLNMAKDLNRPLLVHLVKSSEWLTDFWPLLEGVRFVFHSFSGPIDFGKKLQKFNGYASFNQSVLRRKNFVELVKSIPLDNMLLETDGPYQTLKEKEESRPDFLLELAKKISSVLDIPVEEFSQKIYQNSQRLFYGK